MGDQQGYSYMQHQPQAYQQIGGGPGDQYNNNMYYDHSTVYPQYSHGHPEQQAATMGPGAGSDYMYPPGGGGGDPSQYAHSQYQYQPGQFGASGVDGGQVPSDEQHWEMQQQQQQQQQQQYG